jgi:DNA polymerase III subunit gamma/tau
MSYQVIARKWRPQTFEEVTGQEAITRTLRNAVEHERLHHAYLFSGARGVGKTTTARLLAKALNCHKTDKPNPMPCAGDDPNACASCKEIAESRSIDVLEIDAASHTGVDDIRETILESINFNPARDRYKVFIIDEVHQLSKSAFNALLKTLEEPPARVEFIMATTELHKVPDTILSRCQEFEFRTIALQKIFERLKIIAEAEKIDVSAEALREIARSGEGSMRDAQSNFDQVISFSGEKITIQDVAVALGVAGAEMLTRTAKAIAENKPAEALNVVDDLIGRGQDLRNFCRDLMSFFRDLLVFKIAGDAENLLDTAVLSHAELNENSAAFSESDLIRFFNSLGETESKLREATQPRYILEIGLMKLIEMRRVAPIEKILERLAKLENASFSSDFQTENSAQSKPVESFGVKVEKKTLAIDFPLEEVPFAVSATAISPAKVEKEIETSTTLQENFTDYEASKDTPFFDEAPLNLSELSPVPTNSVQSFSAKMIAEMPIKLLPITSEELEHIEDNYLDSEFERKLLQAGDNLSWIKNASEIATALIGENSSNGSSSTFDSIKNGNGTAFAPAKTKPAFIIPEMNPEEISEEIPVLPENPTEEEMWQYAENHPLVKKALRIFRGKITEITKV